MSKGINPNLRIKPKIQRSVDDHLEGLARGDRFILSEVLTLIESQNSERREIGDNILNRINTGNNGNTIRIGVTGSPGAGKSTFIEALGSYLTTLGHSVAVLAIDPSSTKSKGSILGDKTRMQTLSTNPKAYVRPTASANLLGGVARATKESITVCEAAGYDIILVESVGVGQSETELADLVDLYLLLLLPGGGDGVQGIKRGVVELADLLVINKYDGDRKLIAKQSKKDFASAVRLFHHELNGWQVPVALCSALHQELIDDVWLLVSDYIEMSHKSGHFLQKRNNQDQKWIENQIRIQITKRAEELFEHTISDHEESLIESVFSRLYDVRNDIDSEYNNILRLRKEDSNEDYEKK